MQTFLGIELGSTRIKAVAINENYTPTSSGEYTWCSKYENGIWTYHLSEIWQGLKSVLSGIDTIRIIHGKGTGVLRKNVQAHLRRHKNIQSFRLGTFGEGENGVTIAELNR